MERGDWNLIKDRLKDTDKEKICGFTGDLVNMETLYIFKGVISV